MRLKLAGSLFAACSILFSGVGVAQDAGKYPSDSVRIVVPFAAGGVADIFARVVGDHLQRAFGKPFVVENVPGGSSIIGISQVVRSKPDGLTLAVSGPGAIVINPLLRPDQIPYKPLVDIVPVAMFDTVPNVLVINKSKVNVNSVPELIEYLKKNPGKVAYGSAGVGTTQHLAAEWFQQMTGTKMTHVPYPGSSRMITDLIGGQIGLVFDNVPLILPHAQAGKLTILATASAKRAAFDPNLPAVSEFLPGFESGSWHGFLVPAGTPPEIIQKISDEVQVCMKKPETIKKFAEMGAEAVHKSPKEFRDHIASELQVWKGVIEKANIQVK
jgi:tripartite-type tricarboxylate transporter receptor subunit TctC